MQIVHRISVNAEASDRKQLAALGIVVGGEGFVTFEVDEEHESWKALEAWIAKRKAVDLVYTRFTKQETVSARWLQFRGDWHYGYPQPNQDEFGYLAVSYDLTDYCVECGCGKRQKAPLQIKSEPKWGRRAAFQLNWIFDEFFVTPELWKKVFKPRGIECRPVTNTKGVVLKTVVQLVVDDVVAIHTEGLPFETCVKCRRVKYLPHARGPFPAPERTPSKQMIKTKQYFGSGARAFHSVLVSDEIRDALAKENVRGASVTPVKTIP